MLNHSVMFWTQLAPFKLEVGGTFASIDATTLSKVFLFAEQEAVPVAVAKT
jgi:hypothetical protein